MTPEIPVNPRRMTYADWSRRLVRQIGCWLFILLGSPFAFSQTANLYTKADPAASGGLTGKVDQSLSHAIALHRDHVLCFRAELSDGGKAFRFTGLPTGKYDL